MPPPRHLVERENRGNCLAPKNFVVLSVWGLIFSIFRYNFLLSVHPLDKDLIWSYGTTRILFLNKYVILPFFAYVLDKSDLHLGGGGSKQV